MIRRLSAESRRLGCTDIAPIARRTIRPADAAIVRPVFGGRAKQPKRTDESTTSLVYMLTVSCTLTMCSQHTGTVSPLNLFARLTNRVAFTIKFSWILMLTDNGMPRSCGHEKHMVTITGRRDRASFFNTFVARCRGTRCTRTSPSSNRVRSTGRQKRRTYWETDGPAEIGINVRNGTRTFVL